MYLQTTLSHFCGCRKWCVFDMKDWCWTNNQMSSSFCICMRMETTLSIWPKVKRAQLIEITLRSNKHLVLYESIEAHNHLPYETLRERTRYVFLAFVKTFIKRLQIHCAVIFRLTCVELVIKAGWTHVCKWPLGYCFSTCREKCLQ